MKPAPFDDAESLLQKYEEEPAHPRHVAVLALQLFDGLKPWHGWSEPQRTHLHLAALLHDIGWSQTPDGTGHHKWSARLILDHRWKGLEEPAVKIVAQVARYHRKSLPSSNHPLYQELGEDARREVDRLAGILRVADAFDRTHRQIVKNLAVKITPKAVRITVTADIPCSQELAMFERKRDLLELAAQRSVVTV